ncbi:MAG TPA: hypothetical protein VF138_10960 [Caulobacteraceae bacterium]
MKAIIRSAPDRLDDEVRKFKQRPLTKTAFLNSVPKAGTHLLRNIVRMFVPLEQHQLRDFIQLPNLERYKAAFWEHQPQFSVGHLLYADPSAQALKHANHVILVRDPYDHVLARTRFIFSDQFDHPQFHRLKGGALSVEQMMNFMIFGVPGLQAPPLREMFTFHALAWMGTGVHIVRYEDIVAQVKALDEPAAEPFFRDLLGKFGIAPLPSDWRERVRIGADRKFSATARENLGNAPELPKTLPEAQRRLVDYAAPGVRELLGYS